MPGNQEARHHLGIDIRGERPRCARAPEGRRKALPPALEPVGQTLSEAFVRVGELGGEVPHGASAHAVTGTLRREDLVEERLDLTPGVPRIVPEDRGQGPRLEPLQEPIEDRVTEVLLRAEVVVEVALSAPLSRRTSSSEVRW